MNKIRILQLAEQIDKTEFLDRKLVRPAVPSFCMGFVKYHCGSPACLMGWTEHMFGPISSSGNFFETGRLLGLSVLEAERLFDPSEFDDQFRKDVGVFELRTITPDWAAACLRRLAETGEVDWVGTKPTY